MGRTYFSNAEFAVCGQMPPQEDGLPGGGGILFWHEDYIGAYDDARDVNERGGFAYIVNAPGGEIDPYDEDSSRAEALDKWDREHDPVRVRPWHTLTIHKVKTPADIIDLARVTMNEHGGMSDQDYNRTLIMLVGLSREYYSSDLISIVRNTCKATQEQRNDSWDHYLKERARRYRFRVELRNLARIYGR